MHVDRAWLDEMDRYGYWGAEHRSELGEDAPVTTETLGKLKEARRKVALRRGRRKAARDAAKAAQ